MQQTFSFEFLRANCGCYRTNETGKIDILLQNQKEPVTLRQIFESNIPLKDKYWFLCKKLATKEQNQQIAIAVAEIVLPIFEKRYPEDKRPREAIDAARQYIAGHITLEKLIKKRRDAADAANAADAAYADAADAADAAAYAAAVYAANFAAAAYAAAVYAAAVYAAAQQLNDYLFTFVE